jgi:GT2 family glycosyltransferase
MSPELSIAIVLHNSADVVATCLRSVRAALETRWAELVAVDNASPDESAEIVRQELPTAVLLSLEQNRGFATGANAALARAVGRYWLLLNPDVEVPSGGLEVLVDWMDRHPGIGLAAPDMVGVDGTWESPGRAAPSIGRTVLELTRLHRLLPAKARARVLRGPYWTGGDQVDAGWVPAAAMIVRPAAARAVGELREDLFMYGEDLEWCWRMRRAGWRIGVCSATTFRHRTSSSARASFGEDEKERRVAAGIDAACRLMYGPTHARALAAVTAWSLRLEACAPGRASAHRSRALSAAQHWRKLAARR